VRGVAARGHEFATARRLGLTDCASRALYMLLAKPGGPVPCQPLSTAPCERAVVRLALARRAWSRAYPWGPRLT
jgi:hypothetical protein